jgi:hypothetical protein
MALDVVEINLLATIFGLLASIVAVLGGIWVAARYIAKRFDKWAARMVENTSAMVNLTKRVDVLERTIKNGSQSP